MDVPAPLIHPHRTAVTCTQSNGSGAAGTILLCTLSNYSSGSIFYQPTGLAGYPSNTSLMTNWQVIISSPSLTFNIASNEPFIVDSTGTMDTPFVATSSTQGAAHLTSLNPSTGVMTLTSPNSVLVTTPTAGFIRPGRWSVQDVVTPFGTGDQFVDPLGNWMWPENVAQACVTACTGSYTASVEAKYGGSTGAAKCTAAKYETLDLIYAGFNSIGEDSENIMQQNVTGACSGSSFFSALPSLGGLTLYGGFAFESMNNQMGMAPQAPKDLIHLIDRPLNYGVVHDNVDYIDPNFAAYVFNALGATSFNTANTAYPGRLNCYESTMCDLEGADDVDYMTDGQDDQFWNPAPGQVQAPGVSQGFVVAIAPLHATFEEKAGNDTGLPFIFPNDTDYMKLLSASAPSGCYYPTTTIPGSSTAGETSYGGHMGPSYSGCSWPDFIRNWFNGSLSTMNSAFGISPGYDTFGTDETVVADGVPSGCTNSCVGNGSTTVFTFTLNTTVTPQSIHINITPPSGTGLPEMMVAGDCPEIVTACGITGEPATFGELRQMTGTGGSNMGWASATGYPISSSGWAIVDALDYTEVETAGGESGSENPFVSNKGVGGTTTDGSGSTEITWTNYDSAMIGGAGSFCNYVTGSCQLSFYYALASGTKITVSYTTNGWACQTVGGCASSGGRGIEDEDGNGAGGATIVGTNSAAIVHVNAWAASTPYAFGAVIAVPAITAWMHQETSGGCTSGSSSPTFSTSAYGTTYTDNTCLWVADGTWPSGSGAINDNAIWGLIAHTWIADRVWFYWHTVLTAWADFFPDQMMITPNDFSTTPDPASLETASQMGMQATYVNGMFMDPSVDANSYWKWKEYQTWYPGAVIDETYYDTTQSWTGGCDSVGNPSCPSTMALKGLYWYNHVSGALAHGNQIGIFNLAAMDCFSCQSDIQKHGYGMVKDVNDNLINGIEDVSTTGITCNNGVGNLCGGEPDSLAVPSSSDCESSGCFANWLMPYGYNDLLGSNGVIAANQLWLASSSMPTAPTKSIIFALRPNRADRTPTLFRRLRVRR